MTLDRYTPAWVRLTSMDTAKRIERIKGRVIHALAAEGFNGGIQRAKLIEKTCRNYYRFGADVVDELHSLGMIERLDRQRGYRLSILTVDQLAYTDLPLVAHWYDLATVAGRAFRQHRLDTYFDVDMMPPQWGVAGAVRTPPPYLNDFWLADLEPKPKLELTDTFVSKLPTESQLFWGSDTDPSDMAVTPVTAGSFWA